MLSAGDARILALRNNVQRYCQLLATELTDFERAVIHRRLAVEQLAIEALEREVAAEGSALPDSSRAARRDTIRRVVPARAVFEVDKEHARLLRRE